MEIKKIKKIDMVLSLGPFYYDTYLFLLLRKNLKIYGDNNMIVIVTNK